MTTNNSTRPRQIKPCPKCKLQHGWFEKRIESGEQYFDETGIATHWVDGGSNGGKRKFCCECRKDITNLIV